MEAFQYGRTRVGRHRKEPAQRHRDFPQVLAFQTDSPAVFFAQILSVGFLDFKCWFLRSIKSWLFWVLEGIGAPFLAVVPAFEGWPLEQLSWVKLRIDLDLIDP